MQISSRTKIIAAVLVAALALLVWNLVSGWGLVTVRAYDRPFSEIQRSIERQGGVKIVSNVPPDTIVSMNVERVPVTEALEYLAFAVEGRWAFAYAVGPDRSAVAAARSVAAEPGRAEGFRTFRTRGAGGGMLFDTTPDVRKVRWDASEMPESSLHTWLDQVVQKTGVQVTAPSDWNPEISASIRGGSADSGVRDIARAARGSVEEFVIISARPEPEGGGWDDEGGPTFAGGGGGGRQQAGGGGGPPQGRVPQGQQAEWARERTVAQIAQLPPAQRSQAEKEFNEWQQFMAEVREMEPEQRRAAFERRMNDPVVQERMLEREMRRDLARGPDRRAQRYRSYIPRKEAWRNNE